MKKIVCIHGGPRKNGNTRAVTSLVLESARRQGAEVMEIDATSLEFKVPGCLGCQKCQKSGEVVCSIGDPVAQAVATLPSYDTIVLSTPLYWWSYTAQLKIVIDRMYSLCKFAEDGSARMLLAGKNLALVATAGGPIEDNLALLESQLKNPAAMMGCSFSSCMFAGVNVAPGTLTDDPAVAEKARRFGRELAG